MDYCDYLQGRRLKRMALIAAVLLSVFLSIAGALALSIQAPASVQEGQQLTVSATGAGQITIFRDGMLVASGVGSASDTIFTNSSSAGVSTYAFMEGDLNETRTVQILNVPLAITITSPETDVSTGDVTYAVSTNWEPELCYIQLDGAGHTLTAINSTAYAGTFVTTDGVHTVEYKCRLGNELPSVTKTIHVDTGPPKAIASSPSGDVSAPFTKLTIDTDEIAQCRYGEEDAVFEDLPVSFGTTFALRNTVTVPLTRQGPYTFFVRCEDISGNAMVSPVVISFLSKLPPTASISVSGSEPFKAGTYEVKLKTSAPMLSMPKLTYTFQESARQQQVALSGADDEWSGFLIIPADLVDTVVSFGFDGQSREGISGTQLTGKSLFTIDAKAPAPVDAITVENFTSSIKLRWFSTDASEIASYNIYRAGREGVSYTDHYANSRTNEFTDADVGDARYYYYRVAPIDAAGNIGALSAEVYGSAVDEQLQDALVGDPLLHARIEEEIASMTAALLDANATLSTLEQESSPVTVQVIADMALVSKGRSAVLNIQSSINALRQLQDQNPTQAEVDQAIGHSRSVVGTARKDLIRRVVPHDRAETTQPSDAAGIERGLPYALLGQNLSAQRRDAYLRESVQLQDRATVTLTTTTFTLYELSGAEQDYTFVRKKITLENPAGQVSLIEQIPKSVAASVSEITFADQPVVLEDDPVVMYSLPILEQHEFTYYVKRIVPLDDVKKARLFVYPSLAVSVQDTNLVTGNATKLELPFVPSTDLILIVVGILVIAALGAYYVSLNSERPFKGLPAPASGVVLVPVSSARVASSRPGRRRIVRSPLPREELKLDDLHLPATPDGIRLMLRDAEDAIDHKQYDRARDIYQEAIDHLSDNKVLEQQLHGQAMQVYTKLLLFKRLNDAGAAADVKDVSMLKHALEDVARIASELGEQDTVLISEAKSSYATFVQFLNKLEIEHTGRY